MACPRPVRPLWLATTVSQTGTGVSELALPLLAVLVLGASPGEVGVLGACSTAAFLVVGLPAGALVDRWDARRTAVVADLVRAAVLVTVPLAAWLGGLGLGLLCGVALVVGTATVFGDVAQQSMLPALVGPEELVDANAALQLGDAAARIVGPPLGGALVGRLGAPLTLLLDVVSYLVSALAMLRLERPPPRTGREPWSRLLPTVREGLAFVVTHPRIRRVTLTTGLLNAALSAGTALFVVFAVTDRHLAPTTLGLVLAGGAAGGVAAALVARRVIGWLGERRAIISSALLGGPAMVLVPLAVALPAVPVLVASEVLASVLAVVFNVAQTSARQRDCPPALLGRMNATIRFVVSGAQPLGMLAAGGLAELVGVRAVLWGVAGWAVLAAVPVLGLPREKVSAAHM